MFLQNPHSLFQDNESIRKKRYDGQEEIKILDPSKFPEESDVEKFLEPMVKVRIIVPNEMMGSVNGLCSECRGERGEISSIDETRLMILWRLPLAEVAVDFFEKLKKMTSGYASFDYEPNGWQETRLVKLSISINGKEVSEFSQILPTAMARDRAKTLVQRLKREIPRQQFEVVIKGNPVNCFSNYTVFISLSRKLNESAFTNHDPADETRLFTIAQRKLWRRRHGTVKQETESSEEGERTDEDAWKRADSQRSLLECTQKLDLLYFCQNQKFVRLFKFVFFFFFYCFCKRVYKISIFT